MTDDHTATAAAEPLIQEADLAGRGARLGTYALDTLLVAAIAFAVMWSLGWHEGITGGDPAATVRLAVAALVAYGIVNGHLLAQRGQTVGKMAVGVRIVSGQTGRIVPLWNAFGLRYAAFQLAFQIPIAGTLFALADALFIFGERRRCLHDFVARTAVVNADWEEPLTAAAPDETP